MLTCDLTDRVVWITGANSGIGLATAIQFAAAGAKVIISARNAETLAVAKHQLVSRGSCEAMPLDVADKQEVSNVCGAIERRHGRIDILVNSAGMNLKERNFSNMTAAGWDQVVQTNLSGLFYCCLSVIPGMRARQDGLIINISSRAAKYPRPMGGPAYNATKRAVVALTECINLEEGCYGVRATAVLPGEVATPMLEQRPRPPTQEERERMSQPEDIARAILFVAMMPARTCVSELSLAPTWNCSRQN